MVKVDRKLPVSWSHLECFVLIVDNGKSFGMIVFRASNDGTCNQTVAKIYN